MLYICADLSRHLKRKETVNEHYCVNSAEKMGLDVQEVYWGRQLDAGLVTVKGESKGKMIR